MLWRIYTWNWYAIKTCVLFNDGSTACLWERVAVNMSVNHTFHILTQTEQLGLCEQWGYSHYTHSLYYINYYYNFWIRKIGIKFLSSDFGFTQDCDTETSQKDVWCQNMCHELQWQLLSSRGPHSLLLPLSSRGRHGATITTIQEFYNESLWGERGSALMFFHSYCCYFKQKGKIG